MMPTAHRRLLFLLLALLSAGSIFIASATGSVTLGWSEWLNALGDSASDQGELLWRLRLPRAAAAWTVGALLSLSGS
jgi:ABC-type Fe3+-siderophore transport system permease subunit